MNDTYFFDIPVYRVDCDEYDATPDEVVQTIAKWALAKNLSGVVWTALGPK
jgi:hypothetical protein